MPFVAIIGQAAPVTFGPEQIAAGGATLILATLVFMYQRGDLIARKQHEATVTLLRETIDTKEREIERLTNTHVDEVERLSADRDLWRQICAESLNVSEALVGRKRG